jgi:DNA-directed RNA polymerase specialized sigma24 family protein
MRYPVSAMKIMEWYHVVSSWCTMPETPAADELFRSRLMPDRAISLDTFREMKECFTQLEQLRQRILYSHLRLVISIARQSCGQGQSQQLIDIVQEGNIGLVKALDRFDSSLGHKFSTYATWWIRHEIMRALARQSRVIRIPQHMISTISRINRAEQAFVKRFGQEPTVEELARELEMPTARIHAIRQMARQQISLQAPLNSPPTATNSIPNCIFRSSSSATSSTRPSTAFPNATGCSSECGSAWTGASRCPSGRSPRNSSSPVNASDRSRTTCSKSSGAAIPNWLRTGRIRFTEPLPGGREQAEVRFRPGKPPYPAPSFPRENATEKCVFSHKRFA